MGVFAAVSLLEDILTAVVSRPIEFLRGLSITSLAAVALMFISVLVARKKGYRIRFTLSGVVLSALPGSRRFPNGCQVRFATRIVAFFLGGCRGPWLDISADDFSMRLRPAPVFDSHTASPLDVAWRMFGKISTALSVDNVYWRTLLHNIKVHAIVFVLRGLRLRAERVRIWRQNASWNMKADQLVYVGKAEGLFGSRYILSVNELTFVSYRTPRNASTPATASTDRLDASAIACRKICSVCGIELVRKELAGYELLTRPKCADKRNCSRSGADEQHVVASENFNLLRSSSAESLGDGIVCDNCRRSDVNIENTASAHGRKLFLPAKAENTPLQIKVTLRKGIQFVAVLSPRLLTILRPRRMSIMDDVKLYLNFHDSTVRAGDLAFLNVRAVDAVLCPGYSRSLRAKLPPSAPSTRRPRKPGLLRYWECSGRITGISAKITPLANNPSERGIHVGGRDACTRDTVSGHIAYTSRDSRLSKLPSARFSRSNDTEDTEGLFVRLHCLSFDACGMAADERQEAMSKTNVTLHQLYAGGITSQQSLFHSCQVLSCDKSSRQVSSSGASFHSSTAGDSQESSPQDSSHRSSRSLFRFSHDWAPSSLRRRTKALFKFSERITAEDGAKGSARSSSVPVANLPDEQYICDSLHDNCDFTHRSDREVDDIARGHGGSSKRFSPSEAVDRIVQSQPEIVTWLNKIDVNFDMNCSKRDALRTDMSGNGVVIAVEPVLLARMLSKLVYTLEMYCDMSGKISSPVTSSPVTPNSPHENMNFADTLSIAKANASASAFAEHHAASAEDFTLRRHMSRTTSTSSGTSSLTDDSSNRATLLGCNMTSVHLLLLNSSCTGLSDSLALTFAAESICAPRIIHSGSLSRGLHMVGEMESVLVEHWNKFEKTSNIQCNSLAFGNMHRSTDEKRQLTVSGLRCQWDFDFQTALEEVPDRLKKIKQALSSAPRDEDGQSGMFSADEMCLRSGSADFSMSSKDCFETLKLRRFASGLSSSAFTRLSSSNRSNSSGIVSSGNPQIAAVLDSDAAALAEIEKRERREQRRLRFLQLLRSWNFSGTDICVSADFPDGPSLGFSVSNVPELCLADDWYKARDVVFYMQKQQCLYGCDVQIENPLYTLGRSSDRPRISIVVSKVRGVLRHGFWFGMLLQDWIARFKAVQKVSREARYKRRRLPMPRYRKKPFPDVHVSISDFELYMEDHPLNAFLTKNLSLFQDEAFERMKRDCILHDNIEALRHNAPTKAFEKKLHSWLCETHSRIWIARSKELDREIGKLEIAEGFIPPLNGPPLARLTAGTINFEMVMDEATRKHGSSESMRKLKSLDEYLLGPQLKGKSRQYETDAWNDLGFRNIVFEAKGVRLRFRDFPTAFISIDRMHFDKSGVFGQAVQATTAPYLTRANVAIGRRRKVEVIKSLGSTKTFMDAHLVADLMQCSFNPAYMGAIGDFGREFCRFLGGSRNPSPRLPWFDSMRMSMHGRFRITARTLKGVLSSSTSPYTMTRHFADVEAENVSMFISRLAPTKEEKDPISWELHRWHIRPSVFNKDVRSVMVMDYVKVGLNPVPRTLSNDPQDHYFLPFPSSAEVEKGGLGIGRARMREYMCDEPVSPELNSDGCYTAWLSPELPSTSGYDSYVDHKTVSMHFGVDIQVRQAPGVQRPSSAFQSVRENANADTPVDRCSSRSGGASHIDTNARRAAGNDSECSDCSHGVYWAPQGASVMHSDGISTVIKVMSKMLHRPLSNRVSPKWVDRNQRPSCPYGLSFCITCVSISASIKDINIMFYNNMEKGHGLFVSSKQITGNTAKVSKYLETTDGLNLVRETQLTKRSFEASDIYCALRLPGLEFVDPVSSCGFLLSLSSMRLSCDCASIVPSRTCGERYSVSTLPDSKGGCLTCIVASPCTALSGGPQHADKKSLPRVLSSGFGNDEDLSPFYTFSSNHDLQRGNRLDKVNYSQILAINGFLFLWTPKRRNALISWPVAFKEKSFAMKKTGLFPSASEDPSSLNPGSKKQSRTETASDKSSGVVQSNTAATAGKDDGSRASRSEENVGSAKQTAVPGRQSNGSLCDLLLRECASDRTRRTRDHTSGFRASEALVQPTENGRVSPHGEFEGIGKNLNQRQDSSADSSREAPDDSTCDSASRHSTALVTSVREVLSTNPKFQVMVTDSQICFGSSDTDGLVFLTSESASVGFVDKTIQHVFQCGGSFEKWVDAEHRVHLQRSRVYSTPKNVALFDCHSRWIPREADSIEREEELAGVISPMTRVTTQPISMNLMFVRPRSVAKDDDQEDSIVRPSLLFINVPHIKMDSTSVEFHSVVDVVRKVLMQRIPNSYVVKDELAALRYNLQLTGGGLSTRQLLEYSRRISNIVKQLMYAGDTFQEHLVEPLIRTQDGDFLSNLIRYKAKAAALATYLRSEHRARGAAELYPTMYISYSFDNCSWQLRDMSPKRVPFIELILNDLVCRHVLYIGRGSSSEFTFRNISAVNHLEGGFYKGILQPSGMKYVDGAPSYVNSKIKASDGTPVAFRWSATQMESVGGIPVYDLLTINVAPLNAAISNNLYQAVLEFAFGTSKLIDVVPRAKGNSPSANAEKQSPSLQPSGSVSRSAVVSHDINVSDSVSSESLSRSSSSHVDSPGKAENKRRGIGLLPSSVSHSFAHPPLHARSRSQDVEEMDQRGQTTMLFRYVYIGEFQLTASYRKREDPEAHSVLDITDLTVNSPSYMYSSKVWSWQDFAKRIRKELLLSFAVRGVTNLAKIKLLPGYQQAKHRLKQGTDTVMHGIQEKTTALLSMDSSNRDSLNCGSDNDERDGSESSPKYSSDVQRCELVSSGSDQDCGKLKLSELNDDDKSRSVLQVLFGSRSSQLSGSNFDDSRQLTAVRSVLDSESRGTRSGNFLKAILRRDRLHDVANGSQQGSMVSHQDCLESVDRRSKKPPLGQRLWRSSKRDDS